MNVQHTIGVLAIASTAGLASAAESEIKFDWNSVATIATDDNDNATAFATDFDGRLHVSNVSNSGLLIFEDENGTPSFMANGDQSEISALLDFSNGDIVGGNIEISVNDDIYTADIVPGTGQIIDGGTGFEISGKTSNEQFNNDTFAGIDVSAFLNNPTGGDFINFDYNPGATPSMPGVDMDASFDVFATVIPLPHPAALAAVGVIGVGSLQRRRRSN